MAKDKILKSQAKVNPEAGLRAQFSDESTNQIIEILLGITQFDPIIELNSLRDTGIAASAAGPKLFDILKSRVDSTYDSHKFSLSKSFLLQALLYVSSNDMKEFYESNTKYFTYDHIEFDDFDSETKQFTAYNTYNKLSYIDSILIKLFDFNYYKTYKDFKDDIPRIFELLRAELSLSDSEQPPSQPIEQAQLLDALVETVPKNEGHNEEIQGLDDLNHQFKQRVIERLQPVLNAKIKGMNSNTFEQKEIIADYVNGELASYGLAVKCPKSGLPAKLLTDVGNRESGRFQIYVLAPDGKRHRTSSETIPVLELVEVTTPKEPDINWQKTVGPSSSRTGRKRAD